MKGIGILGPYGSGKTTYLESLVTNSSELSNNHTRIVINDVLAGVADKIKLSRLRAQLSFLTGGCIGCQDRESFIELIKEARIDNIDYFVFEQPGTEHGSDLKQTLQDLGVDHRLICLWDGEIGRHKQNVTNTIIHSALSVADIIGITKCDGSDQNTLDEIISFLTPFTNGGKIPIILIPRYGYTDSHFVEKLFETSRSKENTKMGFQFLKSSQSEFSLQGNKTHKHIQGVKLLPKSDLNIQDIAYFISLYKQSIERVKGIIQLGDEKYIRIDYSRGGSLKSDPLDIQNISDPLDILVYGNSQEFLEGIGKLGDIFGKHRDGPAQELMTEIDNNLPIVDVISNVEYLLNLYPESPISQITGEPIADFGDADLSYIQSQDVRIPEDIKKKVFNQWLRIRIKGLEELSSGKWDHLDTRYYLLRKFGGNIAWHSYYKEKFFISEELFETILSLHPTKYCIKGLLGLKELSFNERVIEESPEFIESILMFGYKYENTSIQEIYGVIDHMILLSGENALWNARWQSIRKKFIINKS